MSTQVLPKELCDGGYFIGVGDSLNDLNMPAEIACRQTQLFML
jgi:hypothetical protein